MEPDRGGAAANQARRHNRWSKGIDERYSINLGIDEPEAEDPGPMAQNRWAHDFILAVPDELEDYK